MSGFKVCGALLSVFLVAACAASQSGGTGETPSASADQSGGAALGLDINVSNTILRVAELNDEGVLRRELEEFKTGLFWLRGLRTTDAVIDIIGDGEVDGGAGSSIGSTVFGQSELYGTISLIDAATGNVVVEPIFIKVVVSNNRDARNIGLTNGSKPGVELGYLVEKFMLAGREALYGKGR
jgi:hypothetical protein